MTLSCRLCAGLLCLIAPASAVDWKALKPQGYVSDFAGVVDAGSRAELESYAARVQQATGTQMAFVTLRSLEGEPIEDVTNDIFHAWGVGQKGEDNGVMFLLSIGDRKSRLEVGGGLGEAIPDGMAGLLLDDMRPALRQGQYGPALLVAAERLGDAIAKSKGVTIAPPAAQFHVRPAPQDSIPIGAILFFIFFFFLIVSILRRGGGGRYNGGGGGRYNGGGGGRYNGGGGGGGFWTGLLLGMLTSGRGGGFGGGRDGGGFGGFDSGGGGGGFGGFGGGDSGGGGASSDW